jgi:hypothetical protein
MIKKFWFMASISANLEGRPQVGFNVVTAIPTRNVNAAALGHIQKAGASMVNSQEEPIPFDDLVIQNLFFLGEMTDEEFVAGTQRPDETADDVDLAPAGDVLEPKLELAVDNTAPNEIGQNNDLSDLDAQAVEATPVDDVTTADVKPQD